MAIAFQTKKIDAKVDSITAKILLHKVISPKCCPGNVLSRKSIVSQRIVREKYYLPEVSPPVTETRTGTWIQPEAVALREATGSQTDGSSAASVGGGRGELLRRIAKQLLRGQQLRVWQTGHHPSRRKSWHGECLFFHLE